MGNATIATFLFMVLLIAINCSRVTPGNAATSRQRIVIDTPAIGDTLSIKGISSFPNIAIPTIRTQYIAHARQQSIDAKSWVQMQKNVIHSEIQQAKKVSQTNDTINRIIWLLTFVMLFVVAVHIE